jgi:hypothetical protein
MVENLFDSLNHFEEHQVWFLAPDGLGYFFNSWYEMGIQCECCDVA